MLNRWSLAKKSTVMANEPHHAGGNGLTRQSMRA